MKYCPVLAPCLELLPRAWRVMSHLAASARASNSKWSESRFNPVRDTGHPSLQCQRIISRRCRLGWSKAAFSIPPTRTELLVTEYQQRVQLASEQYRQQYGTAPLTKEEDRQLQDQVINQMIQDALLEQEYRRLGIRVSAEEIVAMAHNSPLPEIMRDPQFQTDGQFDIRKWQQFLSTPSDRNLLLQLEGLYRQQIPRIKLFEYLASDVYIPDAKLWRLYKDQHDSVRVTGLAVAPYTILDTPR